MPPLQFNLVSGGKMPSFISVLCGRSLCPLCLCGESVFRCRPIPAFRHIQNLPMWWNVGVRATTPVAVPRNSPLNHEKIIFNVIKCNHFLAQPSGFTLNMTHHSPVRPAHQSTNVTGNWLENRPLALKNCQQRAHVIKSDVGRYRYRCPKLRGSRPAPALLHPYTGSHVGLFTPHSPAYL
jgi:hypothetical protein